MSAKHGPIGNTLMPSPKNGTVGSAVFPADPRKALEADIADPGKVEKVRVDERETQTGKYGSVQAKPHRPPQTKEEQARKHSWIEIELVDKGNRPVPGEAYRITLPDGETAAEGTLDEKGFARVDGIEPGMCKVTFPQLRKEVWKRA